jgi:archaellum component FlaC|tara:strand:- start:76 stop:354 length:279 start_codon:yes stop_codon:yes gene_type:complete
MKKYESDLVIQQLIETNQKLTDQLGNLWDEVGYKNDRVRDLNYELAELKTEVKTLKFKWRKCIADRYAQDQEEKEKDKALIDKILSDGRTDN